MIYHNMKLAGQQFVRNVHSAATVSRKKLDGKVAVITGSTYGIGFATAERLAADGASVMISSRKKENVTKAIETLKKRGYSGISGTVCHVAKADEREKLFRETQAIFGGIDILITNAAVNPAFGPLFECSEGAWDKIFEVNLKSSFLLTKEVLPYMKHRGGGSIIYISSIASMCYSKNLGPYGVSKTALLGLTKAASLEVAKDNIRVNCVAPGGIKTTFFEAISRNKEALEAILSSVPMGRIGQPEEVVGMISLLASDDASYITGENIFVAGGMHTRI